MKESDQSRFVRWGIPGWMMFLSFLSFLAIDIALSQDSAQNVLYSHVLDFTKNAFQSSSATAIVALLVAAAGIPVGFFIYQLYFYIRWNSPFSRDGLFPPFIVGRLRDLDRTMMDIEDSEITAETPWRREWISNPLYTSNHCWKWRYIENYFIELVQKFDIKNPGLSIYSHYRYLMELMHTLGAGLFGIYLGYLCYLMAKVKFQNYSLTILLITSFGSLLALIWLLDIEDQWQWKNDKYQISKENHSKPKSPQPEKRIQFSNPSTMYIFFLFTFLYLGSPSPYSTPYTNGNLIFRSIVLLIPVIAWGFSKRNYLRSILFTELFTLIISATLGGYLSQLARVVAPADWWSTGWAVFVFLGTNMVFLKNRQNARDDVITLQNYTFKRILQEEKTMPEKVGQSASTHLK